MIALGLALLLGTPALAQERFRLEDGQWTQQAAFDPATSEGELQQIRRLLAQDQPGQARKQAARWIKTYPNHPMLVEAYLLHGDALVAQGEHYKALFDYERVVRLYPASEQFMTALEREYEIARLFSAGVRRKFLGMRIIGTEGEAEEILIRIQERAPGSELGERASLLLGDHYFGRGNMNSAADAYDLFLLNYPRSIHRERAMLRLIQASLARFKGPRFDSTGLIDASQRLRQYRQEFPAAAERIGADALLVRINESLALKTFLTARFFDRQDRRASAVYMYQRTVRDYPRTAAAQEAVERLADMGAAPVLPPESSAPGAPSAVNVPATRPASEGQP